MAKCDAHEEVINMIKDVKSELKADIDDVRGQIERVDDARTKDREDFIETRTWVKSLFAKVDTFITKVDDIAEKMNDQQVKQTAVEVHEEHSGRFQERIKNLSYELIKWVLLTFVLGGMLTLMQ